MKLRSRSPEPPKPILVPTPEVQIEDYEKSPTMEEAGTSPLFKNMEMDSPAITPRVYQ